MAMAMISASPAAPTMQHTALWGALEALENHWPSDVEPWRQVTELIFNRIEERINAEGERYTVRIYNRNIINIDRRAEVIEDGRRFLVEWGDKAEALGWTAEDLFGLHEPPECPSPLYRRLSRPDATGLIWLLHGRPVIALTPDTAVIAIPGGGKLTFHRRAV
jgi:hypothetical protein